MPLVEATGDIPLKSVLIATDFSEASEKALRHALAIARHYGAELYLAHVVSSLAFTLVGPDAVNAVTDAVCREARQLEDQLVQSGALADLPHEIIVRQRLKSSANALHSLEEKTGAFPRDRRMQALADVGRIAILSNELPSNLP